MEYIFVCSAGMYRSPTAAEVARGLAVKHDIKEFKTDFLGIDCLDVMGNVDGVSKRLNKADLIFVMEQYMANRLVRFFGVPNKKIHNLDIEDIYPIKEYPKLKKELEGILTEKLEPFFKS